MSDKPTPPINPFKKTQASTRRAVLVSVIAIILAIVAGLIAWFSWIEIYDISAQLGKYGVKLQKRSIAAIKPYENKVTNLQKQFQTLQNQFTETQKKIDQLESLSLESQNQRAFSEVAYLVHLANLHLVVTHNSSSALKLLKAAQTQLNQIPSASVLTLKTSIEKDISELEKVPQFDMASLLTRFQNLKDAVVNLPEIPNQKLQPSDDSKADEENIQSLPWYKKMLHSLMGLKELIIIRHDKKIIKPILSPEELLFLKENVQLKISEAEWGLLHQNKMVFQQSLTSAKQLLQQFYPNQQAMTQVLNEIDALNAIEINPTLPDLSKTLKLIHATVLKPSKNNDAQNSPKDDTATDQTDDQTGNKDNTATDQTDDQTGNKDNTATGQTDDQTGKKDNTATGQTDDQTGSKDNTATGQTNDQTGKKDNTATGQTDDQTGSKDNTATGQTNDQTGKKDNTATGQTDDQTGSKDNTATGQTDDQTGNKDNAATGQTDDQTGDQE